MGNPLSGIIIKDEILLDFLLTHPILLPTEVGKKINLSAGSVELKNVKAKIIKDRGDIFNLMKEEGVYKRRRLP